MTTTTEVPAWLDAHYIAADLKMSLEWVRRQCHNGTIPATKVGRSWRVSSQDYATFMRKYRGATVPPARPSTATKRSKRRVA